jgi:UDP-glucose 4-epimerase
MNSKKILVTGGAGAIGYSLIKKLIELDNEVVSWDNYSAGTISNHHEKAIYSHRHTKEANENTIDSSFDLVYHLGEYSKVVPSFDEIETAFDYNILGSFNLINRCNQLNIPIVYAGSSTRLAEPGELHSPYAFFKSTIAKLIEGYSDWYGLRFNICYFYNVFGPGTNLWANEWQSVINIFKKQREEEIPLTITGDGTQKRDFTHVNDIIQGLILAGDNIRNEQFQLGTGKEYSILEIAAAFDHPIEFIPPRPGDRKNGLAHIEHTSKTLGYKPTINVIEYIKSL